MHRASNGIPNVSCQAYGLSHRSNPGQRGGKIKSTPEDIQTVGEIMDSTDFAEGNRRAEGYVKPSLADTCPPRGPD